MTDISRFYLFLSQQENWQKSADSDGNDIITKEEFDQYILKNNSFDWTGVPEDGRQDLINEFWMSIDEVRSGDIKNSRIKHRNALSLDEQKNAQEIIKLYEVLETFMDETVKSAVPSGYVKATNEWLNSVRASLTNTVAECIDEGKNEAEILTELGEVFPSVSRKTTANMCAQEYLKNDLKSTLSQYNFNGSDDLETIINAFVRECENNGEMDPKTISEKAKEIINAYLATAGLKDANDINLTTYGYPYGEGDTLNDLQKAVLTKALKDAINGDQAIKAKYDANKTAYDSAIEAFVNSVLQTDFTTIKADPLKPFLATSAANIERLIEFENILDHNDFKQGLEEMLNNDALFQSIMANIEDSTTVQNLIANMQTKAQNNEFADVQAGIDWLVNEIKNNFSTIIDELGLYDGMSLDEIISTYETTSAIAKSIKENDKKIDEYKKAAAAYCNALAQVSNSYSDVVTNGDYVNKINNAKTAGEVDKLINELKEALANIKPEVTDKTEQLKNDAKNGYDNNPQRLVYYVANDGSITFVNYTESAGPWYDEENHLNQFFADIKTRFESTYSTELATYGFSTQEKENLFNYALFMTLSDPKVLTSMYETINISSVLDKLAENYVNILIKASNDEKGRNLIKDYHSVSQIAGRTCMPYTEANEIKVNDDLTKTIDKYYHDDDTNGSDDWINFDNTTEVDETITHGQYSGSIIILDGGTSGDNDWLDKACRAMVKDYIDAYHTYLDGNRIIELFREAQRRAYNAIKENTDSKNAGSTRVYGYGEAYSGSKDNRDTNNGKGYWNIGNIILQVMFEMEQLIAQEMFGIPVTTSGTSATTGTFGGRR